MKEINASFPKGVDATKLLLDSMTSSDVYLEYLEEGMGKKPFKPTSDWDFITFKRLVKEEWEAHLFELK